MGMAYSASEALFRQQLRPELDPAVLLDDLRHVRPLIDRLAALEPVIDELEGLNVQRVQELRSILSEYRGTAARIDRAESQLHQIEELIQILDDLEIVARNS
jgi:hypothetical protein